MVAGVGRGELEVFADGDALGADVAVAFAALAARAAVGPAEHEGGGESAGLDAHDQALGLGAGDGVDDEGAVRAERGVGDLVAEGAGAVAGDDKGGVVQPADGAIGGD